RPRHCGCSGVLRGAPVASDRQVSHRQMPQWGTIQAPETRKLSHLSGAKHFRVTNCEGLRSKRDTGTDMTVIGYARVSNTDQDLAIQINALKAAGCEVIRSEKRSGTTTEGRAELQIVLDFLRSGDVLMVTRIDRLARSIGDLQDIVRALKARGACLNVRELRTADCAGRASLLVDIPST